MEIEKLKEELKELNKEYAKIKTIPVEERKAFGVEMNKKKQAILDKIKAAEEAAEDAAVEPLDISAPADFNVGIPEIHQGSKHPLMSDARKFQDPPFQ